MPSEQSELAVEGNALQVRLPLSLLGYPSKLLIGAESRQYTVVVDRLAWALALLPTPEGTSGEPAETETPS